MSQLTDEAAHAEEGVKESLRQIQQAFNEQDLDIYARNVTEDLLNMTVYEVGGRDVVVTYSREERLAELASIWEARPFVGTAEVKATEIYVVKDRAFATYDVLQKFKSKHDLDDSDMERRLELFLFLKEEPGVGWQTERSMTVVRSQTSL